VIARLKSPLALSLVDQVLVSAANLILTFWLINHWAPAAFGVFAIVTSVSLAGLSAHQALAGSQLALMLMRAGDEDEKLEALAAAWVIALGVALLVGVATMLGFYLFSEGHGRFMPLLAGLFVGLHVCREHVRTYHFAKLEAGRVLVNDFLQALIVLAVMVATVQMGAAIDLDVVIAALSIATVLASLPTLVRRRQDFVVRIDRPVRRRLRRLWKEHARWALLGAGAAEMQTRGHVLAVSSFFSLADLGIIQAGMTLLRPVGLFGVAWAKVARPVMVRAFAERRPDDAARYANLSAAGFAGMTAAYLVALWLAWPLLSEHVLPDEYRGLGLVVPLWGVTILIGLLRTVYSLEAQCVPLFREAFLASVIAMVTIFIGLTTAVLIGTAASTILVVGAGEGAAMVALIIIIRRHVGRRNRPGVTPEGSQAAWP
jgi:O-antigen/teichoic acid export membrane protein